MKIDTAKFVTISLCFVTFLTSFVYAQTTPSGPALKCLRLEGQKFTDCGAPPARFCSETCENPTAACRTQIEADYANCDSGCTICAGTQLQRVCRGTRAIPAPPSGGDCTPDPTRTCREMDGPNFKCDGTYSCTIGTRPWTCNDGENFNTAASTSVCAKFFMVTCGGSITGTECQGLKQLDPASCRAVCDDWDATEIQRRPCTANAAQSQMSAAELAGSARAGGGGGSEILAPLTVSRGPTLNGGTRRRMEGLGGPPGGTSVGSDAGNATANQSTTASACEQTRTCYGPVKKDGTPCCPGTPGCNGGCKCDTAVPPPGGANCGEWR